MKIFNIKNVASFGACAVITACGGGDGGGVGESNNVQAVPATPTPIFAGVFDGDGLNLGNNAVNSCPAVAMVDVPQNISWGKDILLVNSQNVGYRVCGYRLWVGPIQGGLSLNANNPSAPGSGIGHTSLDYYLQPGAIKSQTTAFSGNIVTVSGNDAAVSNLDLKDATGNRFKFSRVGTSARITTNSYATFAGSYRQVDWSLFSSTAMPLSDRLSVNTTGAVTAVTPLGTMSGQITRFDTKYGVHDIDMTVTPRSGPAYKMVGVIGPGPTTSGSGNDFGNVTLALTGNNQYYASVFTR